MENKRFLKVGDQIMIKRKTDGLDYDLEGGKTYQLCTDRWGDSIFFKLIDDLALPVKVYSTEDEDKFIDKVLNRYDKTEQGVLGVMLSGLKGSGKTVMAKQIAVKSNLPIIIIDKSFSPHKLTELFQDLGDTEACFIFDEIDKLGEDYDDTFLLQVLDGANTTGKKLMLFTCNDEDQINDCLIDRCSRIRYWRNFDELSASMINKVLEDILDDKDEVGSLTDFIQENFGCVSFDNIVSFANEVNNYPTDTYEDLFKDMNLSTK